MTRIHLSLQRLASGIISSRNALSIAAISTVFLSAGNAGFAQAERVLGLDVSYWNRGSSSATASGITQTAWNTAFNTPNANGYRRYFVWVRATRGGTTGLSQSSGTPGNPSPAQNTLSERYDDPELLRTMTRATTAGFFTGPYHFGRPDLAGNTGTDDADHFIEYASAYMRPGYLMPVYDLEAGSGSDASAQFAIDFSNRIYERMRIRPAIYINGNYSSVLQGATQARRDQLAKPSGAAPGVTGPAYPMLWDARYADNTNPEGIPVQTGSPKFTYTTSSGYYGPWDDYGNSEPWSFWQYASTVSIPGINSFDSTADGNVSHGDIEYVKNYLVPAVWWNDVSGDWSSLANWNSGQPLSIFNAGDLNNPPAPYSPHVGSGQTTPFTSYTLPAPRLPGASGSGPTSGQHDTVILERPNVNITVTLSSGSYNIRKLYMRESLNITGGSLNVNYDPTYRPDDSALVLHGGPISAQFSGPVTLSGNGNLTVHTLQVDATNVFTLSGGALTFDTINLMPHSITPAKILISGNVTLNSRSNVTATLAKGTGSGSSGLIDLGGGDRALTIGNGSAEVDLSVNVPVSNGALTKTGAGTMRLTSANTYTSGTTISGGKLLVNNTTGSGTGTGTVVVNGGVLGGTGTISGGVTVNGGGTISAGTDSAIGTLTLNTVPSLSGTTFLKINRNGGNSQADKIALTSGTLKYGGTLVISNAGAALIGGEIFTNFSANAYSSAFTATNLPTLSAGLNWYLGGLTSNGTIKVNRRPVAGALSVTNVFPNTLQIPIATLLNGHTDPDGDFISLASLNLTTTNGVAISTNGGFISYANTVNVADQIQFTISDGRGGTAIAALQILPNAAGRFAQVSNGGENSFTLHLTGQPGSTYYIERSTNLVNWQTISTNVAPGSGNFDYTDNFTGFAQPPAAVYYRLRW